MQVFKLTTVGNLAATDSGVGIPFPTSGDDSLLWVERYQTPGEFRITTDLQSGLREALPLGACITHTSTNEIMMVENHEIKSRDGRDSSLIISGRSIDAWLEYRIVGQNVYSSSVDNAYVSDYLMGVDYLSNQVTDLVNVHINASGTLDDDDHLPSFSMWNTIGDTGVQESRVIPRTNLHEAMLELLELGDFGVKTQRRHPNQEYGSLTAHYYLLHAGQDKSNSVIFSDPAGDLSDVTYFFSNRKYRTDALIIGRYVEVRLVDATAVKYDRRTLLVDGTDIDGWRDTIPVGTNLTNTVARMKTRGRQALRKQKNIEITSAAVSPKSRWVYRKDFNIGDLVSVAGDYGTSQVFRVTEYAETMDHTGYSGQPTLELPNE